MRILSYIKSELIKRNIFSKVFINASWLVLEKIFQLVLSLLVNILVARYLGPEKFGTLSYAIALVGFLGTFSYMGLNGLVIRDLVKFPFTNEVLLGTTFILKVLGSLFAFIVIIGISVISYELGSSEFWILLIIGLIVLASPFEVIDFWFQSQVQSKFTVLARSCALVIGSALKIVCVFTSASFLYLTASYTANILLTSFFFILIFHYKGFSIFKWKANLSEAINLLSQSWKLVLAGIFALINLKVDQILLRWMIGPREVGIYSVAVTFSEIWYFIATAITMSVFPKLIELRKSNILLYDKRLQQIYDVLFLLAFIVACLMTFIASPLIHVFYGEAYRGASTILAIHVWAGIFMFMQQVNNSWVIMEDALYFHLANNFAGAIINLLLNLVLIPQLGGVGAAVSTLISYATISHFSLFFCKKTRSLALKISKAYILPIRFVFYKTRIWD